MAVTYDLTAKRTYDHAGARQLKQYQSTQIMTGNPQQLLVMLYDALRRELKRALKTGPEHVTGFNAAVLKAQDIISELSSALDLERGGDLARNLFQLYLFLNRRLVEANIKKDPQPVREVLSVVEALGDAWKEVL